MELSHNKWIKSKTKDRDSRPKLRINSQAKTGSSLNRNKKSVLLYRISTPPTYPKNHRIIISLMWLACTKINLNPHQNIYQHKNTCREISTTKSISKIINIMPYRKISQLNNMTRKNRIIKIKVQACYK